MRLTASEQSAIATTARAVLPTGSRVLLFGSRTDDSRRGGDIDLLVEPPMAVDAVQEVALCNRLAALLYRRICERRIDIVMARLGAADDRLIIAEARRHGIELVQTRPTKWSALDWWPLCGNATGTMPPSPRH